MSQSITRRKFVASAAQAASIFATNRFLAVEGLAQTPNGLYQPVFARLDQFIEHYMRTMNAPGMTLSLSDCSGVHRIATYGFSDTEAKLHISPADLFEIGSIGKSFTAICLLQLHEEGKLDLHRPVTDYLPWFRVESTFPPITAHHLLTHSSGLPSTPPVFLSDPEQKHRAAYAPGVHFYYCNMGYELLGHLLWTLDRRDIGPAIRERILSPLRMDQSEPVATLDFRGRIAKSYYSFQNDRPYPRFGRIGQAPGSIYTLGAGSVLSTPRDMGFYLQMLANHGQGPTKRLLSEESFALFSKPYIKYWNPDPTSGYGYGIEVAHLDGNTILKHTGGSNSFASSIQLDMDQGVGAFASINAMQGYRPEPVTQFAIRLMRAQRTSRELPEIPITPPPNQIESASDYSGIYRSQEGKTLEFVANGQSLFLVLQGKRVPVETLAGLASLIEGPEGFSIRHPDFSHFSLIFGRANPSDPKSPIVEAGWGPEWYTNTRYIGPREFSYPKEWDAYPGHYHNENPGIGSTRIVLRKGTLLMDGVVPLQPAGGNFFLLRDDNPSPEWIRFFDVVNGKAMRIKLSGEDLWRVMTT